MPSKFHQQQYYVSAALFAICLLLYCFGPSHSRELLVGFTGIFGGFITGKFSNGFKGKQQPDPGDKQ